MRWGTKPLHVALLTVFVALLGLPASASAAPPPNDAFAAREALAGALPITASGTNLEATKEAEEPSIGDAFFGNGHTVWYEWEATSSGFVTVDTCGSFINPVLGVYTGTEVGALTEVAGDFSTQGPECPEFDGAAVTFEAVSGVTYSIVVDGYPGLFGGGDQGPFEVEIDLTPAPANDDFADAETLAGEEEGRVYSAGAEGFNWGATKEPGEPAHAGDPGGASIWFSWTAPTTGNYGVMSCGKGVETVLALYTGTSVGALTPVGAATNQCNFMRLDAIGGTDYRLAIDGRFDGGSGSAAMSALSLDIFREPPSPPDRWSEPPWLEARWVNTSIQKRLLRPNRRGATFVFGSTEAGSRFICKLDRRPERFCTSPKTYRRLQPGKHVFRVAAIGDTSPAVARFQIPKQKPRPKK